MSRFAIQILKHKCWMSLLSVLSKVVRNPRPMVLASTGSSVQLAKLMATRGARRVLLVTDQDLVSISLHKGMVEALEAVGCDVSVYSDVSPNPTEEQMSQGIDVGKRYGCDTVLGFGGGSPMDAAKIIAAGLTNDRPIAAMEGAFKLKVRPCALYVVPTTAGTGSEVTIAAVVTNVAQQRKYTVADTKLVPIATALDPELMTGLPVSVTAATGVDALTHAVEAYISTRATDEVMENAGIAVRLIFSNLRTACNDGSDLQAREAMAIASYHAGLAIADVGVGYVHAIAHQLGGFYHVPHGLANAVVLPHVLDFSEQSVVSKLADLARSIDIGQPGWSAEALAKAYIDEVRQLQRDIGLPDQIEGIQEADIPLIVERALQEAFDYFAVPRYMKHEDGRALIEKITA